MKKNVKSAKAYLKPNLKKPAILEKIKLPGTSKKKPARRQDVRLHQHLLERFKTKKEMRLRKRAEYLATLPKGKINKILYLAHPKRVIRYIFSRDGLIMGLRVAGIGVLLMMVFSFVVFAYYRKDLPKNITDLKSCSQGQKTSYYDRTGEVLLWRGEGDVDCQPISLANVSPYLQKAVIAAEDQKFYSHPGFDMKATVRAAVSNAKGNDAQQGGSTLTQQYVKLAVLSNNEKRLSRKIKELILSIELERTYKKDEILQAYLNEISFGSVYNGAEAASQGFFGKSAKDLTLDEAATFAAAIQAPGNYWDNDEKGLIARRNNYVLENMVKEGYVTRAEADAAKKVDTIAKVSKSNNKYKDIKAPYFVLEVQRQLESELGASTFRRLGYKVITTLDMTKQGFAETAIANGMEKLESANFDNSSLVSEDVRTGQVVAYVGGRDFNQPGWGRNDLAYIPRSPGSSVKPYDYANLMKESPNWGAGSIFYDWQTKLPGWPTDPKGQLTDYGGDTGSGPSTMRRLLGNSKNIPAVKAVMIAGKGDATTGISSMHRLMESLGVKTGFVNCGNPCDETLSTAIGDGGEVRMYEHVHGMATLARGGKYIPQLFVLKILDKKGKVIRDNTKEPIPEQVLDPQIAYIINDMLSDVTASFFRSTSRGARELNGYQDQTIPTAIKTGTTNNNENGWMMGYTPEYATGNWAGNHDNQHSPYTNGMHTLNGPIWGEYMRLVYEGQPVPAKWERPAGIKTITHDSAFYNTVKPACSKDLARTCGYGPTDIYPSWYTVKKTSTTKQKVVIDTVSGKRATSCTPERAKKEITGGGIIVPELDPGMPYYEEFMKPISLRLKNAAGEAIPAESEVDTIHQCSDTKPTVTISMPANCSGSCTISATASQGTHALKNIYFKMDGAVMTGGAQDTLSSGGTYTFDLVAESSGNHEFTAEVVDEALYDASASTSSSLTGIPFNLDSANTVGANVKLTWDDIGGTYSLSSSGGANGLALGCTPVGSKCTANVAKVLLGASGSYTLGINSTSPARTTNTLTYSY